jgi:hypothetical protein
MMLFQWLVFLAAIAAGLPFICRLSMLHPSLHRWPVIAMHIVMACSVAWGGYRGWMHDADFGDLCSVLAPLLWIWISFGNWRDGVPPHFRRPGRSAGSLSEIDMSMLPRVSGGRKS